MTPWACSKAKELAAPILAEASAGHEEQGEQQHESPTTEVLPGTSGGGAGLHANRAVVEVAVERASTPSKGSLGSCRRGGRSKARRATGTAQS